MSIKSGVRTITPAEAHKMLEKNSINRPPKPSVVARYARDMLAGNWKLNGEAILRNSDGTLLNGQNRLLACIEAGVPFETLVVDGLDTSVMDSIDIGLGRSMKDLMHWHGADYPSLAASVVSTVGRYDYMVAGNYKAWRTPGLSPQEGISFYEGNRELVDRTAEFAFENRHRIPGPNAAAALTHFLISREVDPERADSFYERVIDGTDASDSGSHKLRNWLLENQGRYTKPSVVVYYAMHIKAANFWLEGRAIGVLLWKRAKGDRQEAFPRLVSK